MQSWKIMVAIFIASLAISIYFYPFVPEKMASHWNAEGKVNGYMPKNVALFLIPFIILFLSLLFIAIPKVDPMKSNIKSFKKYYDGFVILFLIFMLSLHIQIILWNTGLKIPFNLFIPLWVAILFFYIGILLENAQQNWFIGIRTPWTLSSEKVWNKTHRLGGKLFKIAAFIALAGIFFPKYAIWFILLPALAFAFCLIAYSYFEYQKS
ncbi:MAG: SdpI family protein [Thermoplasmata archaeon]|nr:MAG: SdpI family protein [Thermoplasmata archaeon]